MCRRVRLSRSHNSLHFPVKAAAAGREGDLDTDLETELEFSDELDSVRAVA